MRPRDRRPRPAATIVCFSNLDWTFLRYRKQHLMDRLAAHYRVIYVNPPRAGKCWRPDRFNRIDTVKAGLWVYEPIVLPGIRRSQWCKAWNDRLVARAVARLRPVAPPVIAWCYSPHSIGCVERLAPQFVIYDMADDYTVPSGAHSTGPAEDRELRQLAEREQRLLRRADLVLCVSAPLLDKASALNRRVRLLPNGCDVRAHPASSRRPRQTRPVIGYVGTIAPRFDLELILALAARRPDWDFELAGPVTTPVVVDWARVPSNLRWVGEIPYDDVPARIASFDVAILPLRDIPFAYRSSPIQVFDYLAAGKPVVASPVAQFESRPDLVTTACGVEGFARAIAQHLEAPRPWAAVSRRSFAMANSWDRRTAELVRLLDQAGFPPAGTEPVAAVA